MRGGDRRELPGIWLAVLSYGLLAWLAPLPSDTGQAVAPADARAVVVPVAVVVPRPMVLSDSRSGATTDRKTVALTFDDGPDPLWTHQVLELLQRHRAVATFCMVGDAAHGRAALVRRVVAAGMRLCDHSRTHDLELASRPLPQVTDEIAGMQVDLADAAGAKVDYFRAPGGNWSPELLRVAVAHGMQPLGWSVDPRDWQRPGVEAIVATVEQQVHPGAIVLLHDGGGNRAQTLAALERLLPWLVAEGYTFTFPTT